MRQNYKVVKYGRLKIPILHVQGFSREMIVQTSTAI